MFILCRFSKINRFCVDFRKSILKNFEIFSMSRRNFKPEKKKNFKIFSEFFKKNYMVICFIENGTTFGKKISKFFEKFCPRAKFRPKNENFLPDFILMDFPHSLARISGFQHIQKPRQNFCSFGHPWWHKSGQNVALLHCQFSGTFFWSS